LVLLKLRSFFESNLAESVFVSVSIKKGDDTGLQRAVTFLFISKNDNSKRNCTIPFVFSLLDYCIKAELF